MGPGTQGIGSLHGGPGLRPPRKLYRVSEIAEAAGVTRQTIHNYATIGLIIEEKRTAGGQRLYDESVFAVLGRIRRLKAVYRLRDIRRMLEREERASADQSAAPPALGGVGADPATPLQ